MNYDNFAGVHKPETSNGISKDVAKLEDKPRSKEKHEKKRDSAEAKENMLSSLTACPEIQTNIGGPATLGREIREEARICS